MSDKKGEQRPGFALHRIENFSDAVFAFAVTLLVVSLEVPKSAHELFHTMHGFIAFGACFILLITVWAEHTRFFRNYPLGDAYTVALNMTLLFTVLLYVYPMKFLFSLILDQLIWGESTDAVRDAGEVRKLMLVYGFGVLAVNTVLFLMHAHAYRLHAQLRLSASAMNELRNSMWRNITTGIIAIFSIMIASMTNDNGLWSGFIYILVIPAKTLCRFIVRSRVVA